MPGRKRSSDKKDSSIVKKGMAKIADREAQRFIPPYGTVRHYQAQAKDSRKVADAAKRMVDRRMSNAKRRLRRII